MVCVTFDQGRKHAPAKIFQNLLSSTASAKGYYVASETVKSSIQFWQFAMRKQKQRTLSLLLPSFGHSLTLASLQRLSTMSDWLRQRELEVKIETRELNAVKSLSLSDLAWSGEKLLPIGDSAFNAWTNHSMVADEEKCHSRKKERKRNLFKKKNNEIWPILWTYQLRWSDLIGTAIFTEEVREEMGSDSRQGENWGNSPALNQWLFRPSLGNGKVDGVGGDLRARPCPGDSPSLSRVAMGEGISG